MRKIVLTFGLLAGAVMSVMMVVTVPFYDSLSGSSGMVIGYASMLLASVMIFVGIRTYRDSVGSGSITYWQGAKVGLAISAVAIACYVLTWEIIYYGFFPDFGERYAADAVEALRASGASVAEIAAEQERLSKWAESYRNPLVNIAFTALEPLPVTLLVTLVSAGVLKRSARAAA